ncbi:hypothetical protein [Nocardia sp. IFM 10818]
MAALLGLVGAAVAAGGATGDPARRALLFGAAGGALYGLAASLPAVAIAEPLAAAFIGLTVLEERLRTGGFRLVVVGLTVIVRCAATVRLSRVQAEV